MRRCRTYKTKLFVGRSRDEVAAVFLATNCHIRATVWILALTKRGFAIDLALFHFSAEMVLLTSYAVDGKGKAKSIGFEGDCSL